ncbi:MAG TPA: arginine--tRNA ligase [Casimicrobiaceae bacterium]|nr:arginine--tRNA ligase [Casimicrobiaceae bacterium]
MTDLRTSLRELLALGVAAIAPERVHVPVELSPPKQPQHGDFASNVALQHAKALKRNPREVAQALVAALPRNHLVERIEIAGAGFINVFVTAAARQAIVATILSEREDFGRANGRRGERVMVEFVSANPTGPLHVGHGRQAALGDAIARLLEWQGADVTREFYYNDAGQQIQNLALSVRARAKEVLGEHAAFPDDGYHGEYIRELAQRYLDEVGHDLSDVESIRRFAVAELRKEQDRDLQAFGVKFDNYYLESSLYTDRRVDATVARLVESGKTFEHEGALWLRTTDYGDDKDRVMRKSDGGYTYFVPDVAYHVTKWERGFTTVINVQGSDHHSTVTRVRAGLQATGIGAPPGYPEYVIHKMVTVMKGGEEVKISKRAGSYVTLRDLIDEVGRDAVRFFLVSRKPEAEFVFDIDLARSQTEANPVFYVQYAHARFASVMKQAGIAPGDASSALAGANLAPLTSAYEEALLRRLGAFPEELAVAARESAPHLVTAYLRELAAEFHSYYNAERFLVDDPVTKRARLALVAAAGQTIRNGLAVLGIGAPEQM